MDHHVRVLDQSSQHILAGGLLQIQGHTALVAIEIGKACANVCTGAWAHRTKTVPLERLYFRDLGAKVAKKLGGIRPQYHRGEIHHFDAFKQIQHGRNVLLIDTLRSGLIKLFFAAGK